MNYEYLKDTNVLKISFTFSVDLRKYQKEMHLIILNGMNFFCYSLQGFAGTVSAL